MMLISEESLTQVLSLCYLPILPHYSQPLLWEIPFFFWTAVLLSSKTDLIISQITEWFVETEERDKQNYLVNQTPNTLALKEDIYIGHIGQEFWSKLKLLGWLSEVKHESCLWMAAEICPSSTKHKNNSYSQTWLKTLCALQLLKSICLNQIPDQAHSQSGNKLQTHTAKSISFNKDGTWRYETVINGDKIF